MFWPRGNIGEIQRTWIRAQGIVDAGYDLRQDPQMARVEKEKDERLGRKRKLHEVDVAALNVVTLFDRAGIAADVFFGDLVQIWREFQAKDSLERKLGCQ